MRTLSSFLKFSVNGCADLSVPLALPSSSSHAQHTAQLPSLFAHVKDPMANGHKRGELNSLHDKERRPINARQRKTTGCSVDMVCVISLDMGL